MKHNTKLRNDLILVVAIILCAGVLFGLYRLMQKPGACAVVSYDGREIASFPLDEAATVLLTTDGRAEVLDVPDDFCDMFIDDPLAFERSVVELTPDEAMGWNLLMIRDGKADMISASCPDLICVNQHPVSKSGETITCLPNKTIVTVEAESGNGNTGAAGDAGASGDSGSSGNEDGLDFVAR